MCASSPNTSLKYFYDFNGDGVEDFQGPFCQQTRTYYLDGVQVYPSARQPSPSAATPQPKTWTVVGCAQPRNPALTPQDRRCATGQVIVDPVPAPSPVPSPGPTGRPSDPGSANQVSWSSDLQVAGASGQIVTNGSAAAFVASGRAPTIGVSAGQVGWNRIEAQLVQAAGKPGTWRFDLGSTPGFVAGSLRVVAGDLALATGDALVFRMKGVPGERVVFTFAKEF
jgi:hypothetical protein